MFHFVFNFIRGSGFPQGSIHPMFDCSDLGILSDKMLFQIKFFIFTHLSIFVFIHIMLIIWIYIHQAVFIFLYGKIMI